MTKFEYFSMAHRLWRGFESVTRVRALVVCLFLALVIVLSSQAAATEAGAHAPGSTDQLAHRYDTSRE